MATGSSESNAHMAADGRGKTRRVPLWAKLVAFGSLAYGVRSWWTGSLNPLAGSRR